MSLATFVAVPLATRLAALPFRDGSHSRWYRAGAASLFPAAVAAVVSLALPPGPLAGALAVPWLVVTLLLAVFGVQRALPNTHYPAELAVSVGFAYLPVAGVALVLHRIDATAGFAATTLLVTVVHFDYAGCVLPVFAGFVGRDTGGSRLYSALLAVVLVGPGLIGVGIALSPAVELLDSTALAVAVAGVALRSLGAVRAGVGRVGVERALVGWALVGVASVSVVASMVLVVAYLATPWLSVQPVSFEAVLVGHGLLDAVGFALAGLVGWRVVDPPAETPGLGMPLSRLTSRGSVGPDYLDRYGVRGEGEASGMVEGFSAFEGPGCDPSRIDPDVRRFYERTADYTLDIAPSWSPGFGLGARLYAQFSRRIGQMNFPVDGRESRLLSSRIVPVEDDVDGRSGVRAWIRTYESDRAIYVALYSTHRFDGKPYMNIAFPLPGTNLTSVLSVEPLGVADPDGVELTTLADGEAGIYLRTPLGPLRVPMDETIRVWSPGMDVEHAGRFAADDADLYAHHEMFLFGGRFLQLDYRMDGTS